MKSKWSEKCKRYWTFFMRINKIVGILRDLEKEKILVVRCCVKAFQGTALSEDPRGEFPCSLSASPLFQPRQSFYSYCIIAAHSGFRLPTPPLVPPRARIQWGM
jgi:hypothetical protein